MAFEEFVLQKRMETRGNKEKLQFLQTYKQRKKWQTSVHKNIDIQHSAFNILDRTHNCADVGIISLKKCINNKYYFCVCALITIPK